MAKPNKIIPLAGAGGDSSFVLKVWLAIWRSSSVLGQKFMVSFYLSNSQILSPESN